MNIIMYIDCENIHSDYADQLFEKVAKLGPIVSCTGYADFSNPLHCYWRGPLLRAKARAVQVFHNSKDGADAEILIDVTLDALRKPGVDALCVVSRDGIYSSLARVVRESGKTFIGAGGVPASRAFIDSCDIYIDLVNLGRDNKPSGTSAAEMIDQAIESGGGGRVLLSEVGQRLSSMGFNVRDYGCFKLVEVIDQIGGYEVTEDPDNYVVKYIEKKAAPS